MFHTYTLPIIKGASGFKRILEELEPAHAAALKEYRKDDPAGFSELMDLLQGTAGTLGMFIEPDPGTIATYLLAENPGTGCLLHTMDIARDANPYHARTLADALNRVDALDERDDRPPGLFTALKQFILIHEASMALTPTDRNELIAYLNANGA